MDDKVEFLLSNIDLFPDSIKEYYLRVIRIYTYYNQLLKKGEKMNSIEGKLYCDNSHASGNEIIKKALNIIKSNNTDEYLELLDVINTEYDTEYSNEDKVYNIKKHIMEYSLKHGIDCYLFTTIKELFDACYNNILVEIYFDEAQEKGDEYGTIKRSK